MRLGTLENLNMASEDTCNRKIKVKVMQIVKFRFSKKATKI